MSRLLARLAAAPLALALAGCTESPDLMDAFTTVEIDALVDADGVADEFINLADGATTTLKVAVPRLTNEDLADALVDAFDRGVEVQVISDIDVQDDVGFGILDEAGVPYTLACDEVSYNDFALNQTVSWPSESVTMSHSFAVADQLDVVMSTRAGDAVADTGTADLRPVLSISSQDLAQDLDGEFIQVFGGTDAGSLTEFSALAKSVTDNRWAYWTQSELVMQTYFGPQERLVKRITDAVYRARASVFVLSGDIADEGLTRALQNKAANGFTVKVVVGGAFGSNTPAISDTFATQSASVLKYVAPDANNVPTVVLIDYELDRNSARSSAPMAFVLTHDLLSASRLYYSTTIPTDQLIDGTLVVFEDPGQPSGPMLDLLELVQTYRDTAEAL